MKNIALLIAGLVTTLSSFAQVQVTDVPEKKHPFVNITEVGGLFGRVKVPAYNYYYPSYSSYYNPQQTLDENYTVRNTVSITIQTFNGAYIDPKTAVGFTTGIDWYNNTLIMPIALGIRRDLVQRRSGGAIIYAGLDGGYGTTWINADDANFVSSGGLMLNPTIGYKMPTRGGSAWVINFGYKHQTLTVNNVQRPGEFYFSEETRRHNRVAVRFGFEF